VKWTTYAAIIVLLSFTACAFFEPDELLVMNLDGPPVTVTINGTTLDRLVCQFQDGDSSALLRPGDDSVPPLPWSIGLVKDDGTELGAWEIDRLGGRRELVVRSAGGALKSPGPAGPVPVSNPGCPEAGLQTD
jgi:hypothetical protein